MMKKKIQKEIIKIKKIEIIEKIKGKRKRK